MYLFYVFKDGSWEFYDSVKWSEFDDCVIAALLDSAASYTEDDNIRFINVAKFVHDMIHYKQFVTNSITIYYIDMPG